MAKILYAGWLGQSLVISAQFTLEVYVAARNREKFTKTPNFGRLKSFKIMDVDISKKIVASAKQHVCAYLQPFSR